MSLGKILFSETILEKITSVVTEPRKLHYSKTFCVTLNGQTLSLGANPDRQKTAWNSVNAAKQSLRGHLSRTLFSSEWVSGRSTREYKFCGASVSYEEFYKLKGSIWPVVYTMFEFVELK